MTMRLVNWNVGWATPRSQRTPEILSRIHGHTPDIVCLTETHGTVVPGWAPDLLAARHRVRAQGEHEEGHAAVAGALGAG